MIQMLEFICSIPNWLSWTIGCVTGIVIYQLGKALIQRWKDHPGEEEMDALEI